MRLASQRAHELRQARPLLELLKPGEPVGFTQVIIDSLGRVADHPDVVPSLVAHLEVESRTPVKEHAAQALGKLGDARAVPVLERLSRNAGAWSGVIYRTALGAIGGAEPARALGRLFDSAHSTYVRMQVAKQLGRTDDPEAVRVLEERTSAPDPVVRGAIARALGSLGGERATEILVELLDDESASVRMNAAKALTRVGTPAAVEELERRRRGKRSLYARRRLGRQVEAARRALGDASPQSALVARRNTNEA